MCLAVGGVLYRGVDFFVISLSFADTIVINHTHERVPSVRTGQLTIIDMLIDKVAL